VASYICTAVVEMPQETGHPVESEDEGRYRPIT
jgi:hypothetical protein